MKNVLMHLSDKLWLRKRAIIESINDLLMTVMDIDDSRHRSPWNAIIYSCHCWFDRLFLLPA